MTPLPSPKQLIDAYPLTGKNLQFIETSRREAEGIFKRSSSKIAVIVGPCSIHDLDLAIEYGLKLKKLLNELQNLFLVMRVFIEKPRTSGGWKGLIHDPDLNGTSDIEKGMHLSRKLLQQLTALEIPCAMEFLDPFFSPYFEDLISWGMIGARTSASQPHRLFASGLPFPVGFKNSTYGEIDVAIQGILTAKKKQTVVSIDPTGHVCKKTTSGNPFAHLVLRGSDSGGNYEKNSLILSMKCLEKKGLKPHFLIDCSHGNSQKDHTHQGDIFKTCIEESKNGHILGLMLESHLRSGKQRITSPLSYGVSITDACIGFEETEELLRWADQELCPTSINSVQR